MNQKNMFEMLETKVTNDAVSAVSTSSMKELDVLVVL